jgi:hypothetical protein
MQRFQTFSSHRRKWAWTSAKIVKGICHVLESQYEQMRSLFDFVSFPGRLSPVHCAPSHSLLAIYLNVWKFVVMSRPWLMIGGYWPYVVIGETFSISFSWRVCSEPEGSILFEGGMWKLSRRRSVCFWCKFCFKYSSLLWKFSFHFFLSPTLDLFTHLSNDLLIITHLLLITFLPRL